MNDNNNMVTVRSLATFRDRFLYRRTYKKGTEGKRIYTFYNTRSFFTERFNRERLCMEGIHKSIKPNNNRIT